MRLRGGGVSSFLSFLWWLLLFWEGGRQEGGSRRGGEGAWMGFDGAFAVWLGWDGAGVKFMLAGWRGEG